MGSCWTREFGDSRHVAARTTEINLRNPCNLRLKIQSIQPQVITSPKSLKIGGSDYRNDLKFFVGHAGAGANTFSAVMHPFLPDDVALEATLVYDSTTGKKAEQTTKLKSRC